jgi:SAM-dependent methyltransferase
VVIARHDNTSSPRLVGYVVPATGNPEPIDVAATRNQIDQWRSVFQSTHAGTDVADATFDITGWTSSYTGQELPAEQMRDWVEETVARIRALRPRRVLEIGVGTGLLMWRLAPDCERYVGTDFSASTLSALSRRLRDRPVESVQLLHREADELSGFASGEFDCVVINSVVQYFPHTDYLRNVLTGVCDLLDPDGSVFVGDVRHLGLLDAFHYDAAAARLDGGQRTRLHQEFRRRRDQENELVLSPAWFGEFAAAQGLATVSVSPKVGRYDNELSRYRYDVVLSKRPAASTTNGDWRDCATQPITLVDADQLLARDSSLLLTRVPNALVLDSARAAAELLGEELPTGPTTGALRASDLAALAAKHGLPVAFSWQADHPHGAFDVAVGAGTGTQWYPAAVGPTNRPTANDPSALERSARLALELKEHLAGRLPAYLVPDAVVCLPTLPLSINGKLKTDELPEPGVAAGSIKPRTPVERQLADIWSEVLNVEGIGISDNFFDLGGNSLVATRVIARAHQAGLRIGLKDLFQRQTIEDLAAACQAAAHGEDDET